MLAVVGSFPKRTLFTYNSIWKHGLYNWEKLKVNQLDSKHGSISKDWFIGISGESTEEHWWVGFINQYMLLLLHDNSTIDKLRSSHKVCC